MSDRLFGDSMNELVAAYMLGALPPEESAEVEQLIAGSHEARDYADWLRPALESMQESVAPRKAPDELRARVLEAVADEARAEDLVTGRARPDATHAPRRATRWRDRFSRPAAVGALTGALLFGGIGLWAGSTIEDAAQEPVRVEVVSGTATASLLPGNTTSTLELNGLGQPAEGRVYELWREHEGTTAPVGVFVPESDGQARVAATELNKEIERLVVTEEPRGGSPRPTGERVATLELRR
ncbi:MAG: anti-sigma factor [Solirubrobacterales bacterium]